MKLTNVFLCQNVFQKMSQTAKLFKTLISETNKIPDFNFRNYFLRRVTDIFHNGQELRSQEEVEKSLAASKISVEMLQRQAAIGHLFNDNRNSPVDK